MLAIAAGEIVSPSGDFSIFCLFNVINKPGRNRVHLNFVAVCRTSSFQADKSCCKSFSAILGEQIYSGMISKCENSDERSTCYSLFILALNLDVRIHE